MPSTRTGDPDSSVMVASSSRYAGTDHLVFTIAAAKLDAISSRTTLRMILLLGWALVGVSVAVLVARRAHDLGPLAALGLVLGPFLAIFAKLSEAARLLPDLVPAMVLPPGRASRALSDHVTENGIDTVVAVGEPARQGCHPAPGSQLAAHHRCRHSTFRSVGR